MHLNWSEHVLLSQTPNVSVTDLLHDMFVVEWSTTIKYEQYFNECAPLYCTYTKTNQINPSFAFTLFISLYGGLIIVLRLAALSIVHAALECRSMNRINLRRFGQVFRYLNLFKEANKRTLNDFEQQRLFTRVYLVLFFGMIRRAGGDVLIDELESLLRSMHSTDWFPFPLLGACLVLLLFTSLSSEVVPVVVANPSLENYKKLELLHSKTMQCPCSNTTLPFSQFLSVSPVFHQICSSEFLSGFWFNTIENLAVLYDPREWRSRVHSYFQFLSNLCYLADTTTDDAIGHFLSQYFVLFNVINEDDFDQRFNATLEHFYQSTMSYFNLLVDTVLLLAQVDQPYLELIRDFAAGWIHSNLVPSERRKETSGHQLPKVWINQKSRNFWPNSFILFSR